MIMDMKPHQQPATSLIPAPFPKGEGGDMLCDGFVFYTFTCDSFACYVYLLCVRIV